MKERIKKQSDEWYVPEEIIHRARLFWGTRPDLDPCSCKEANRVIKAAKFFTFEQDALVQDWGGAKHIWFNPPYSNPRPFVNRLLDTLDNEGYANALVYVKADSSTAWYEELMNYALCLCQLDKRVPHWGPNKSSSNNFCSVLMYLCSTAAEKKEAIKKEERIDDYDHWVPDYNGPDNAIGAYPHKTYASPQKFYKFFNDFGYILQPVKG